MTALTKYQRLEATGLWRDSPGARATEVVVGLREATLVLSDPRSEVPLTQWSLPAIQRQNPGQMPALFAPGSQAGETLELDDPEMIAALNTVRRALERRKPRPGRLRGVILAGTALVVVGVLVFWLPAQVKTYTADMLPDPLRADLGDLALADLARLTGQPCKSVPGQRAAIQLAKRLFPDAPPRIEVLRDGLSAPAHLPGPILLLPAKLVESADSPEVIAGHLLAETLNLLTDDPVDPVLDHMGLGTTLRLLTTGTVPPDAADGFGEIFLAAPAGPPPDSAALLAAFDTARISSGPYGRTKPEAPALLTADPYPQGSEIAVLSDEVWIEFQAICTQ